MKSKADTEAKASAPYGIGSNDRLALRNSKRPSVATARMSTPYSAGRPYGLRGASPQPRSRWRSPAAPGSGSRMCGVAAGSVGVDRAARGLPLAHDRQQGLDMRG